MAATAAAAVDPLPTRHADVVVVGAGVLGCAVAFALGRQGRRVILLERWLREPDRIVGELLQPGGCDSLRRLGLGDCLDGIDAIPCDGYTVICHGEEVVIDYPALGPDGEVANPWGGPSSRPPSTGAAKRPQGRSFHHGRFIGRLRAACARSENVDVVEAEVKAPVRDPHSGRVLGVEALATTPDARADDDGPAARRPQTFLAPLTIAADGYASTFRKQFLPHAAPEVRSRFYALELLDCPLPRPRYGHVVISRASPVLMYQIGARETRILIDVPHGIPEAGPAAGGVRAYIRHTVVPLLPEQVRASVLAALDRAGAAVIPRSMPNSYMPAPAQDVAGLVILGDAVNMRHPLTGGGMTVALNDALLLATLLHPARIRSLTDAAAVAAAVDTLYVRRKDLTGAINVLAQALYSLFAAADDRQLAALRAGCFEYFRRGIVDGPAGLLAGLIRRPSVLAYHFFSVALLAVWVNAMSWGVLGAPLALVDAVLMLWRACVVFLPVVWREMM